MGKSLIQRYKTSQALKKISRYQNVDGWLSQSEALGLYSIARKLSKNAIVVEIGSWKGKSTFCISKGIRSGKVYAIDPFNADAGHDPETQLDYERKSKGVSLIEAFQENMESLGVADKIVVKKGYSYNFHSDFDNIDFLFVDGDHSIEGCKLDFDLFAKKIKPGGFIAFHDYYAHRPELGPTHVVDEIIKKATDFSFYALYDSLWVGKKQ